MSPRETFSVPAAGGTLGGFVVGSGPPVLALHGGPGLSYSYLDGLVEELKDGYRVASYQQRGLEPSTLEGPFTVDQAIQDVVAVLDGLDWPQALVVGHSWGGHLALRLIAAYPDRLRGVLAVDPIGVVGDGGVAAFEAELVARTPQEGRARAQQLDERAMAGQGTPEEAMESLEILWPAYFADPASAPQMPPIRLAVDAYAGAVGEMTQGLEQVAAGLAATEVPFGIVAGGGSPIPWGLAAQTTVELSDRSFLELAASAGHFIWLEAPGRVRQALDRLSG